MMRRLVGRIAGDRNRLFIRKVGRHQHLKQIQSVFRLEGLLPGVDRRKLP